VASSSWTPEARRAAPGLASRHAVGCNVSHSTAWQPAPAGEAEGGSICWGRYWIGASCRRHPVGQALPGQKPAWLGIEGALNPVPRRRHRRGMLPQCHVLSVRIIGAPDPPSIPPRRPGRTFGDGFEIGSPFAQAEARLLTPGSLFMNRSPLGLEAELVDTPNEAGHGSNPSGAG